jgi:hypothetical protein
MSLGVKTLRAAEAAPIGNDQAREARELTRKSRKSGVFPVHDDIRPKALEIDKIDGTLAY